MTELFTNIQEHAVIWMVVLLAIFIIDILVHIFFGKKTAVFTERSNKKEERGLLELAKREDEAFLLVYKKTGIPFFVSENLERIFGLDSERVYADLAAVFTGFQAEDQEKISSEMKAWDEKETLQFQVPWMLKEAGQQCQMTLMAMADSDLILWVLRDITEQMNKMKALEQEIIQTRHSEEAKTVFLSNMSHEIRTPLNGMLGMIDLTKMNLDDPKQAGSYLEKAEELSKFLLSVINDILDMSRIESGKTELESVPFDIRQLGNKLENMFRATLEEKGIQFSLQFQDIKEPYVIGDELRISQVLTNFLSNASKFTPKDGSVLLAIRQMDVVGEHVSWMLRVSDTGKGMSPEFLHRIFQPFEQEDSGITRKYGGSGLGMAIADNLVKLMGGQILVESELGKGTTFTVFLKLKKAQENQIVTSEQQELDDANTNLSGRRLLLAEDHPVNAMIVVKMLGTQGISVEVAKNGKEAVALFETNPGDYFDAILMDIHMPEMNGWDAARAIRQSQKKEGAVIPIFALSADAFVEDKRKSIEAGMDGHITKPIDYKELRRALQGKLR